MKTIYLVCYDIESDKWRKKLSDRLISHGLERIQYSVFAGPLSESLYEALQSWIKMHEDKLLSAGNSIIFLKLLPNQLEKMCILGEVDFDLEMLSGKTNTLIL